jgi:hypothetical protein
MFMQKYVERDKALQAVGFQEHADGNSSFHQNRV